LQDSSRYNVTLSPVSLSWGKRSYGLHETVIGELAVAESYFMPLLKRDPVEFGDLYYKVGEALNGANEYKMVELETYSFFSGTSEEG
jgi:hypothetical protein